MNPDRRDVLKVLGVLGLGGGVSALYASQRSSDDSAPRPPTATPRTRSRDEDEEDDPTARSPTSSPGTRTPDEGNEGARISREYTAAVEQVGDEHRYTPSLPEAYTFDYDPVDVRFEDRWIARFVATPAAQGIGDRLRLRPGTRSATDLVTLLRNWHGVPNEQWRETQLAEQTVRLYGGTFRERTAVFGTLDSSPKLVVGARARDETTLERILSSWTLDLEE
jgi:hypothetical protein